MLFIRLLTIVTFLGSVLWFVHGPDYEPGLAVITSLSALVGNEIVQRRKRSGSTQSQTLGKGSVGVQAGRDAHVGNIKVKK